MARVVMIPTGVAEWGGLVPAFERLFPNHAFEVIPSELEVNSNPGRFPINGFTSFPLTEAQEHAPPESALDLVGRAALAVVGDRAADRPTLVVVLDDLELANVNQPERVIGVFRAAVRQHLDELNAAFRDRTRDRLREKVSFHLAAPMLESWFFADPAGLAQACAAALHPMHGNRFSSDCDPECFLVDDPGYAAASENDCPEWIAHGRKKPSRPKWLSTVNPRSRYPKGYLQWLCLNGNARSGTNYSEKVHGIAALGAIHWPAVLARTQGHLRYLSSLIADMSAALGEEPATGTFARERAPLTDPHGSRPDAVLRNL